MVNFIRMVALAVGCVVTFGSTAAAVTPAPSGTFPPTSYESTCFAAINAEKSRRTSMLMYTTCAAAMNKWRKNAAKTNDVRERQESLFNAAVFEMYSAAGAVELNKVDDGKRMSAEMLESFAWLAQHGYNAMMRERAKKQLAQLRRAEAGAK